MAVAETLDETLAERGARYGEFIDCAEYADAIKRIYESSPNWKRMQPDQREALSQIATKQARILNGNYDYEDNWHDIGGYARLVEMRLVANQP